MKLTATTVRNAKPANKLVKLFDGGGLYLQVTPSGNKGWRFKYRFKGKEKLLSLGVYPDVNLKQARDRQHEMRQLLANDVDPSEQRKAHKVAGLQQAENSFEVVAREWFAKYSESWADRHADKTIRRLEKDIFPWLGEQPITDITAPKILSVLRRIENRGAIDTAYRALGNCGQILRYAVATGRAERNPCADLKGALPPAKNKHFAAVIEPKQVGELLRSLDCYQGTFVVQCALQLAPLLFVRPGELRTAEWKDIDFEEAEWKFTVSKTKILVCVGLIVNQH